MEKLVKPRGKPMLFPSFIPPFPPYNHERDQIFFQYSSNPIVDRSFDDCFFSRLLFFVLDYNSISDSATTDGCVLFRQCPFPLSDDRDRIMFQQLA